MPSLLLLAPDESTKAILFVGFTFLLTTSLMVGIVVLHARRFAAREKLWREFALENRFEVRVEPRTFLRGGSLRMFGEVGGLALEFSTFTVKHGKSHQHWARLRARREGAPSPRANLLVKDKQFLDFVSGAFGGKPAGVGDEKFDKRFVVQAEPEEFGRETLVPELREDLLAHRYPVRFSYSDGESEYCWQSGMETREQLARAVEMQARLFGGFARGQRSLG